MVAHFTRGTKVFIILLTVAAFLAVCILKTRKHSEKYLPPEVKAALNSAGSNKSELLNVIDYYSDFPDDSLKLKAAYFLISNMSEFHYYEGEILDKCLSYLPAIRDSSRHRKFIIDQLDSSYTPFSYAKVNLKYDIQHITAEELMQNIDIAFKVWQEQPWGKDYSFGQFCEYILPFKMKDEVPEYNRYEIYRKYNGLLDSVRAAKGDAVAACTVINQELAKNAWCLTWALDKIPHFPISTLIQYQTGSCRDQSDFGAYIMRSVGIPVSIDFIPQWPTSSVGHSFNAVIDKNKKAIMFGAADDNPGISHFIEMKKGKVYRYTVEKDIQSLSLVKGELEIIPDLFKDPYLKDVTDEYTSCLNIKIPLSNSVLFKEQYKHAYLCACNGYDWRPIQWGNIKKDSAYFAKMEEGIIYLPAYYDVNGIVSANDPFILLNTGTVKFIIPDTTRLIRHLTLKRVSSYIPSRFAKMKGGYFQASNSPDFRDAIKLLDISTLQRIRPFWNEVKTGGKGKFRYVRYFRSGECRIGEMQFFCEKKKLTGRLICSRANSLHDLFAKENAVDGDLGTSFSSGDTTGWIGMDFGRAKSVDSIRFSAGIGLWGPQCFIRSGHKYQLGYWRNGHWKLAGQAIAKTSDVTFNNIPSNALYTIQDITNPVYTRIFTIDNGKQVWW